jgi:nanoRNase/pAp phosphatase (c-di-AMP/oligoRNAs hydrolase)
MPVRRLVLGCGSLGRSVVDALADRGGELRVLDPDESRVETLRNEKIVAERADVADPEIVAGAGPADVVLVAGDDSGQNRAAAAAAVEACPDAIHVVYVGDDATAAHRAAMRAAADRLVDPGAVILDVAADALEGGAAGRLPALKRALQAVEGTLGVFTHDNPDPDAIAAAVALCRIAESIGIEAEPCYYGEISHQENRALINLLDIDLRRLEPGTEHGYDAVALVDHSRPGINDQLPPETAVTAVIDHHPTEGPIRADFVDNREEVGATSTLLAEYVQSLGIDPGRTVATGLLYGIRVDTKDFLRETSQADFEATAYLLPFVDADVLERVESPSMNADTLETIGAAIENRTLDGAALASCTGSINDRDALAQAADRLLAMEGVTTTMVYGYTEDTVYVSARSQGDGTDLGAVLRGAFGDVGSAGGHAEMAGAQLPLGILSDLDEEDRGDESLRRLVESVVNERFFEALHGVRDSATGAESSPGTDSDADAGIEQEGDASADARESPESAAEPNADPAPNPTDGDGDAGDGDGDGDTDGDDGRTSADGDGAPGAEGGSGNETQNGDGTEEGAGAGDRGGGDSGEEGPEAGADAPVDRDDGAE